MDSPSLFISETLQQRLARQSFQSYPSGRDGVVGWHVRAVKAESPHGPAQMTGDSAVDWV